MIKKIDHLVITTANLEKCLDFYTKLGFTTDDENCRYQLFAGDFKINVHVKGKELSPHARNVMVGSADLCFEIEGSLNEFADNLISKGIKLETEQLLRNGVKGRMNSIYLRDPDGNLLEFSSYN